MLFRTHIVFALAVYFLFSYFFVVPSILFLIFVLVGAVFVDIDSRKSRVGRRWYFRPLQFFVRHRGIFHSLFFAILFSLIIARINRWAGIGFFVGYISHLFLDSLTDRGVKLFWPLPWKIKGFIRSGGIIEDVVFVLLLLGNIFVVGKVIFG